MSGPQSACDHFCAVVSVWQVVLSHALSLYGLMRQSAVEETNPSKILYTFTCCVLLFNFVACLCKLMDIFSCVVHMHFFFLRIYLCLLSIQLLVSVDCCFFCVDLLAVLVRVDCIRKCKLSCTDLLRHCAIEINCVSIYDLINKNLTWP